MKRRSTSARRRTRSSKAPHVGATVLQIVPMDPGWHALYEDHEGPSTVPIICLALVEFSESTEPAFQSIRPMVAMDDGVIDDVMHRDGFVGLIPPCMHDHMPDGLEQFDPDEFVDADDETPKGATS